VAHLQAGGLAEKIPDEELNVPLMCMFQ